MRRFTLLTDRRLTTLGLVVVAAACVGTNRPTFAVGVEGEPPISAWSCAPDHPVKGNFTAHNGEPCIYHVPDGNFYSETKPERCYASEGEARADGCRRSKR